MKQFFTLTIALMVIIGSMAQNTIETKEVKSIMPIDISVMLQENKTPTDTIFIYEYFQSVTNNYYYSAPNYGYIIGTHWDTTLAPRAAEVAQGYAMMLSGYGIEGVMIWTNLKNKTSVSGSSLEVKIQLLDDSSHYSGGQTFDIICPGTVLGTTTVTYDNIDTADFTYAQYSTPIYVDEDFAVSFNWADFYSNNDTLSIIGGESTASAVYGLEYTWYLYPSGTPFWTQFSHVWTSGGSPIDAAICAFPVVDRNYINVGDPEYYYGMQLSQNYPNPAPDGNTNITYALDKDCNVTVQLLSVEGKVISTIDEGYKTAGKYTITFDQKLSAGMYLYSLIADGKRLTKSMIVE